MENNERLDKAIEKVFNDLDGLAHGSQEYERQVKSMAEVYKLKLEEDKQLDNLAEAQFKRGFESEKFEHEKEESRLNREFEEKKLELNHDLEEKKLEANRDSDRERFKHEREQGDKNRELESRKVDAEKESARAERKGDLIRVGVEVAKLGLVLLALGAQSSALMRFEMTGIASSKAWNLLPGLKNLIKI